MFLGMDYEKVIYLYETLYESGVKIPAIVTKEEVTVKVCRRGLSNFESVDFELIDTEIPGYYKLTMSKNIFDQEGNMAILVQGPGITDRLLNEFIGPYPLGVSSNPGVCTLIGSILDLSGKAPINSRITFKIVDVPKRVGEVLVSAKTIETTPDANGNFSVNLLCGSTVLVDIPTAGIKNQITIPDQKSVQLTEILPERP